MKYIKGNLVQLAEEGNFDCIIHGCNCFNTMNSGVAKAIRTLFPETYVADCKTTKGDRHKLGTFSYAIVETFARTTLTIYNAYTQYNYGNDTGPHFDMKAFIQAMTTIRDGLFKDARIGIPMIGSGLAGGNWVEISKVLEEIFTGYDLTVVVLE